MTNSSDTQSLLNLSQVALQQALSDLEDAKKTLQWARDRLVESQLENRKLSTLLLKFSEEPDPPHLERLLAQLERPCGFRECQLTKDAAETIRAYAVTNKFLREEIQRLKNASDSR